MISIWIWNSEKDFETLESESTNRKKFRESGFEKSDKVIFRWNVYQRTYKNETILLVSSHNLRICKLDFLAFPKSVTEVGKLPNSSALHLYTGVTTLPTFIYKSCQSVLDLSIMKQFKGQY